MFLEMPNSKNNSNKVKMLAEMLAASKGAQKEMPMSAEEWEQVLSVAGEDVLDDGLAIMNEEEEMRADIKKEAIRKKQVNKTRFLQRDERLRVEAEKIAAQSDSNQNKNV